uniref:Protein-tyrosine phosphatase n=1 Tax=Bursaphelenchus xylophilus TaxID=6326 RepID=A0A1I7SDI0_BURXY
MLGDILYEKKFFGFNFIKPAFRVFCSHEPQLSPEQRQTLRRFSRNVIEAGITQLCKEFAQIQHLDTAPDCSNAVPSNLNRCRYRDVVCWDHTRVRLNNLNNDFIHANLVKHSTLPNEFICCQGPLDSTAADFWEMVWQERTKLIIMLCQTVEEKRNKCAQYWPKYPGESRQYGPFLVRNEMVDQTEPGLKRTHLIIRYNNDEHSVQHCQWSAWKDRKAPKGCTMAFRLLAMARKRADWPTIVHCSAGVGRTGTLVLLAMLRGAILSPTMENVSTLKLLRDLRTQRGQCIQTEDQYLYVHLAMLQYAVKSRAVTIEEVAGFVHDYENYLYHGEKPRRAMISPVILMSPTENRKTDSELDERNKSFRVSFHTVPMHRLMANLSPFRSR